MTDIHDAIEALKGLCIRFEGVRLEPYLCPAGVPTIAVGATRYADGTPVRLSDAPITRETAMELLTVDVERFVRAALKLSPILAAEPARLCAVADFCFNLGTGRYKASTLKRKVDAGEWQEAAEQLSKWVWGGGRKLPGLVARRAAEAQLMIGG